MRNAVLDLTPIIPPTACHQRNCVERYSRYMPLIPNISTFLIGGCDGHGGSSSAQTSVRRCPARLAPKWLCCPCRSSLGQTRHFVDGCAHVRLCLVFAQIALTAGL